MRRRREIALAAFRVGQIEESVLRKIRMRQDVEQAAEQRDAHFGHAGDRLGIERAVAKNAQAPRPLRDQQVAVRQPREAPRIREPVGNLHDTNLEIGGLVDLRKRRQRRRRARVLRLRGLTRHNRAAARPTDFRIAKLPFTVQAGKDSHCAGEPLSSRSWSRNAGRGSPRSRCCSPGSRTPTAMCTIASTGRSRRLPCTSSTAPTTTTKCPATIGQRRARRPRPRRAEPGARESVQARPAGDRAMHVWAMSIESRPSGALADCADVASRSRPTLRPPAAARAAALTRELFVAAARMRGGD